MKMTHAVAALMLAGAFALPVAAQTTPATPGKDAVKAERDKARADQHAVRQDKAAMENFRFAEEQKCILVEERTWLRPVAKDA